MVYVIDGMDAVDACYHFAGVAGVLPFGLTLRQLWRMADGRIKNHRLEMVQQANLVWGMDSIDIESYLFFGQLESTGKGGPVQLDEETQAKVDAEVERLRKENPHLPQFKSVE